MKSGKYGSFLIMDIESKIEGCKDAETAFDMSTAIITGMMWVI